MTENKVEWERVFEGTYHYLQDSKSYCEEIFHLEHSPQLLHYRYHAEILSRVETGEFFKMRVTQEVNKFFNAQSATIERSLGDKLSLELFAFDSHNQVLKYTFVADGKEHSSERPFGNKHQLVMPCFATAGLFTLNKKLSSNGRTGVMFVSSPNEWEFKAPLEDRFLYVETNPHSSADFVVGGTPLPASKYELFESESVDVATKPTAELIISKHYGLPYQLQDVSGVKILVKRMKKTRQDVEKVSL
jgi:hypothetical protein